MGTKGQPAFHGDLAELGRRLSVLGRAVANVEYGLAVALRRLAVTSPHRAEALEAKARAAEEAARRAAP